MNLLGSLKSLYKKLIRRHDLDGVTVVEYVNDVPEHLGNRLYVVRRAGIARRAFLHCPCRCGLRIDLNLSTERYPQWQVRIADSLATITPSVWVPEDRCGSHFFVRGNKVEWVS